MRLPVQDFLAANSLTALRERHGVKHRWSATRPGVFTLNYDQLEVCDTDPLSQECRGLILRATALSPEVVGGWEPVGHTEIVALPFARFFNHGTGPCAAVDMERARFYEKLDGTLCIVHHDLGGWHVATRSVPDADVPIEGSTGETFRGLFERALRECGESCGLATELGQGLDERCTYLFELTAPENQVVVRYEERSVSLLGIRNRETGDEYPAETLADLYLICPSHPLSADVLLSWVGERDPSKHEGLVLCDDSFRRCKVKSPAYIALAHVRDSVGKSARRMMELILLGKDDEARPHLPGYLLPRLDAMKAGLAAFFAHADAEYARLHHADRKTFALRIQAEGAWMGAFMARYSGRCASTADYAQSMKREGTWSDAFLDLLLAGVGVSEAA